MAAADLLETIQEEGEGVDDPIPEHDQLIDDGLDLEEELEEWETTNDLARLRFWKGVAKANHSKSIKRVLLALRLREERTEVDVTRRMAVHEFEMVERRHARYMSLVPDPNPNQADDEKWLGDVTAKHANAMQKVEEYLSALPRSSSSTSSRRSGSTHRSRTSSLQSRLLDSQREQQETELRLRQEREESQRQEQEDERLRKLEADRRAAESKVASDRRQRQLANQLEVNRKNTETLKRYMGLDDTSGGAGGAVIDLDLRNADPRILETQMTTEEQVDDSFGQLPSFAATNARQHRTVRFHPDDMFIDPPTHWEDGTVDLSPHEEFFSPSGENDQVIEQPYDRLLSSFGVPPTSNALRGWGEWNRSSYGPAVSQPVIQRPPVTTYHGPAAPNRNVSLSATTSRESFGRPLMSVNGPAVTTFQTLTTMSSRQQEMPRVPFSRPNLQGGSSVTPASHGVTSFQPYTPATQSIGRGECVYSQRHKSEPPGRAYIPPISTLNGPATTQPDWFAAHGVGCPPLQGGASYGSYSDASRQRSVPAYGQTPHQFSATQQPWANGPTATSFSGHAGPPPDPPFAPDEWIFDIHSPSGRTSDRRPPKSPMPKFDGEPLNWPMFIQSFKVHIHDTCSSDAERLDHLRSCLSPEIQQHLGQALVNPGLYRYSLMELHRKFGNPRVVSTACSSALLKLTAFRDNDYKAMKTFAASLHSVVATLRLGGYGVELHSSTTLAQLVSKLPPILRSKWADVSYHIRDRLPNVMDLDSWLDDVFMAEYFVRVGVSPPEEKPKEQTKVKDGEKKRKQGFAPKVFANQRRGGSCPLCNAGHQLSSCNKFKEQDPTKRSEIVKELNCCYRCFDSRHLSSACEKTDACGVEGCKRLHHPLLHGAPRMYPRQPTTMPPAQRGTAMELPPQSGAAATPPFNGTVSCNMDQQVTLLPIVPVVLHANGQSIQALALLDTGSEITMLKKEIADKLGLKGPKESSQISTFHARDPTVETRRVSFKISSLDQSNEFDIEDCYAVPTLNLTKRATNYGKLVRDFPHLAGLPLAASGAAEVAVLIGADHPIMHEVLETRIDLLKKRAPRAIRTPFGWCVIGPIITPADGIQRQCHTLSIHHQGEDFLSKVVDRFLLFDTYEAHERSKPPIGREEARALRILDETTRFLGDRYEAGLLWRNDNPNLPDNSDAVLRRFLKLEKRLMADKALGERYSRAIDEYISLGHARKLSLEEISSGPVGRTWLVPHHPVLNPNKPDKCRPVFDASAVHRGASLNAALLKGPDMLTNLIGVLLRFRENRIALSADIVKMFHQVRVRPADGPAFRFYWREPGTANPPSMFQMDVQIFGSVCSPTICAYVLRRAAADGGADAPVVTRQIEDHFYVDNWLTSFETEDEAIRHATVVSKVLQRGGFELAQWGSSSAAVLQSLPGRPVTTIDLDLDDMPVERTLGLSLNYGSDTFIVKAAIPPDSATKREILRATASIYDPCGFLSPILLRAKLIL